MTSSPSSLFRCRAERRCFGRRVVGGPRCFNSPCGAKVDLAARGSKCNSLRRSSPASCHRCPQHLRTPVSYFVCRDGPSQSVVVLLCISQTGRVVGRRCIGVPVPPTVAVQCPSWLRSCVARGPPCVKGISVQLWLHCSRTLRLPDSAARFAGCSVSPISSCRR